MKQTVFKAKLEKFRYENFLYCGWEKILYFLIFVIMVFFVGKGMIC